jgi:hypothetical protein
MLRESAGLPPGGRASTALILGPSAAFGGPTSLRAICARLRLLVPRGCACDADNAITPRQRRRREGLSWSGVRRGYRAAPLPKPANCP